MSYDPRIAYLEPLSVTGCVRAGVHDVAQSLTRTSAVLICRKAIPILARGALKVSLSGNRGVHTGRNFAEKIIARAGLLLGCGGNGSRAYQHRYYQD